MNDKDVWLYGKWHCSEELSDIIKEMKRGDKFYINMPRGNRKTVLKWITTNMVEHLEKGGKVVVDIPTRHRGMWITTGESDMIKAMMEQLKSQDEMKEHFEMTMRTMVETLPPDVQTIVHNAERLDAEKHWYKWRLEYAMELLEKGEVVKAKELLTQTDVDFKSFSELWEKANAKEHK